jgi:dienelactone hydrolase
MNLIRLLLFTCLGYLYPLGSANAQWNMSREAMLQPPLKFEPTAKAYGVFESLRNSVFLPEGKTEALPAVVLIHSCSGIHSKSEGDLRRWTQLLLYQGYAVLVIDHLGPRNIKRNCGREFTVPAGQLVKDTLDAISFLTGRPEIDPKRIFTLGFSKGAMTGGMLASEAHYREVSKGQPKPRAVAGLYGGCDYGRGGNWLPSDASVPILWLMGAEDTEAPPSGCASAVRNIAERNLITAHIYPDVSHCWDCKDLNGFSKISGNGERVTYRYDSQVTSDSERRVLEFFGSFR